MGRGEGDHSVDGEKKGMKKGTERGEDRDRRSKEREREREIEKNRAMEIKFRSKMLHVLLQTFRAGQIADHRSRLHECCAESSL